VVLALKWHAPMNIACCKRLHLLVGSLDRAEECGDDLELVLNLDGNWHERGRCCGGGSVVQADEYYSTLDCLELGHLHNFRRPTLMLDAELLLLLGPSLSFFDFGC